MSKETKHQTNDRDIQLILGVLLRTGVILSMGIVLTGGVFYMLEHSAQTVNYSEFVAPTSSAYSSIISIFKGLASLKSTAIIQFGILLLIFTPVMRVVFSVFGFILERDYLYVLIGLIVLAIILISLNGGLAG